MTNRQMWVLNITVILVFTTHAMMMPLVPLYGIALGASPFVIGLLVSAAFLLPLFFAVPTGVIVDRLGTNKPLLIGAIGIALAPLWVVLLPSIPSLAISQIMIGVSHLVFVVAAQAHVASFGQGKQRERNFGWYTTSISAGQLVGPLLAGMLVDLSSYSIAFGIASFISALGIMQAMFIKPVAVNAQANSWDAFKNTTLLLSLLGNPGMKMAIAVSCGILIALVAHQAFLPAYLDLLAFSATTIGLLMSLRAFASMLVRPFMSSVISIFRGRLRTIKIMLLFTGIALSLTGIVDTIFPLIAISIFVGIGAGISQPISMVAVVDHIQKSEWGLALGIRLTGNRFVQATGPILLGIVAELAGFTWMFLTAGIALLLLTLLVAHWGPAYERAEGIAGA